MKIIKNPIKVWNYTFVCAGCEAELEASQTDIIHRNFQGDLREPSYDKFYLQCPCCSETSTLKESDLPKLVIMNAKSRALSAPIF